jgi:site-specific recombinase XerD
VGPEGFEPSTKRIQAQIQFGCNSTLILVPERVGLPYHSPHKFRHGHAVYALKMAKKGVFALKAVSQNLMHENLSITDGIYGIMAETDVK